MMLGDIIVRREYTVGFCHKPLVNRDWSLILVQTVILDGNTIEENSWVIAHYATKAEANRAAYNLTGEEPHPDAIKLVSI